MTTRPDLKLFVVVACLCAAGAYWYAGSGHATLDARSLRPAFAAEQDQPRPTFKTEANYVRVDVFPTKDGQPVSDLTADDFEVLEEKVPQKIDAFEHVVIRGNVPQDVRRDPNTVAESRAMLENANARVFVIFLDIGHVDVAGAHAIRKPLVDTLDRVIGEDDLVAVMTPDMSATDVTFARKTTTIEGFLTRHWAWGERDRLTIVDPVEQSYETCYGPAQTSAVTAEMIARRREKQTLDALEDLVVFLRGVREERKAILAITDGWRLYGPSSSLENSGRPTAPPVGVVPGTGKLGIGDRNSASPVHFSDCERDRLALAQLEDRQEYLRLLDEANRANASFYPVDPRGLAVFDSPISKPLPLAVDAAMLRQRADTLRTLADATDGIAILSNDLAGGLRRIVADVSSYYLLGYYSTGKLDGRFHAITVRVKRPGVQVRARRGYLAATPPAATSAGRPGGSGDPIAAAAREEERRAMERVLAPLGNFTRELPLRIQAAAGWPRPDRSAIWVIGELASRPTAKEGADVELTVTQPNGGPAEATAHAKVEAGGRSFSVTIVPAEPLPPDDYVVRVRVRSADNPSGSTDVFRLTLPAAPDGSGALLFRRGPATGNREVATADLRFRRSEQIRIDVPAQAAASATARLLDRVGAPLAVPVPVAVRDDADGSRWLTARLALAPLGVGDYVVELQGTPSGPETGGGVRARILVAFRVIP